MSLTSPSSRPRSTLRLAGVTTWHLSGVDPLLALDRAGRAGELSEGELVLLLAAGTGYTWAAGAIRCGDD